MTHAKSKEEYIREWYNHIDTLNLITLDADETIGKEVFCIIKKLKHIVMDLAENTKEW